jgi:serine/threonine-protein kinase
MAGRLVYIHRGLLYAVRFDPDRLEASGPPVPLLDDVAANEVAAAGRFDFAAPPNGSGLFAYMSGKLGGVAATLAWLDKTGKTEPAHINRGGIAGPPILSPDGRMAAFNTGSIGMENIKVWDTRREVLTAITSNSKSNTMPVWTPDGRHLVFSSSSGNQAQLWWARPDGGGDPVKLLDRDSLIQPSSFSPDGSRLAFSQTSPENGQDLWTVPLDIRDPDHPRAGTPELFLRTGAVELQPTFSPDGRWISYVSQEAGPFEVFVRPFPGPGGRWQISSGGGSYARWSRTGKQLFFTSSEGRIMVADYEVRGDTFLASKSRLWTPVRISTNYGGPTFDLAPDGRILTSTRPAEEAEQTGSVHVTFLLNFFDELKRKQP